MEFRGPDDDGGEAVTVALFSYRTTERLSKKLLHEEIVRKTRNLLKKIRTCCVRPAKVDTARLLAPIGVLELNPL